MTTNLSDPGVQWSMISNNLNRYAWAFDWDELDLMGDCFAREARVQFPAPTGLKVGREAVVAELERRRSLSRPQGALPWHIITNVFVRPQTPTTAIVASWWSFGVKPKDGPLAGLTSFGWYDDTFVLEDNDWRVATRRVLMAGER